MLIRTQSGTLLEININDFLTDSDYYKELLYIKGIEIKSYS